MTVRNRLTSRSAARILVEVVILAALIAPLAAQMFTATPPPPPPGGAEPVPSGLAAALDALFDPDVCHGAFKAEADVRALLSERGLAGWSVQSLATDASDCVSWSLRQASGGQLVTLLPTASPEVLRAMARVREETYVRCINKSEMRELIAGALEAVGEAGFEISSEGPLSFPIDRQDEVLAHYEAGCAVYSGFGWSGHFVFYISGKA